MHNLEKLKPLALLLLRLGLGAIFIYHGYPKLFGNTREAMAGFVHMGFPSYFVYIAGAIEFFGGCLLVVGLFTRVAALLIAGEMAVALVQVHKLFAEPRAVHNYEFPLALAVAAFALATTGAGAISLDATIYGEGRSVSRTAKKKDKN
jgi:putative oxidoreductase